MNINDALKPVLKPKKGDRVIWSGKGRGPGAKNQNIVIWQGLKLPLIVWAAAMNLTDNGLRRRLKHYPIELAMDPTFRGKKDLKRINQIPVIHAQSPNYVYCAPVTALL